MNELKHKVRSKDFKGILSRKIKLPQIDVIREVLKRIDLSGVENFTSSIVKKAKVFKNGKVHAAHNAVFISLVGSHPKLTTDFDIPLQTLYKMMHKRWDIENSTFNKLRTYAGLDPCFVHHTNALEAILHLMVTANNIMQLFVHRRLTGKTVKEMSEKELICLIEKDMYTYKGRLVIDTC